MIDPETQVELDRLKELVGTAKREAHDVLDKVAAHRREHVLGTAHAHKPERVVRPEAS